MAEPYRSGIQPADQRRLPESNRCKRLCRAIGFSVTRGNASRSPGISPVRRAPQRYRPPRRDRERAAVTFASRALPKSASERARRSSSRWRSSSFVGVYRRGFLCAEFRFADLGWRAIGFGGGGGGRPAKDAASPTPLPSAAAHGLRVRLEPRWHAAGQILTPQLLNPRERMSLGTFRVRPGGNCDTGGPRLCGHGPHGWADHDLEWPGPVSKYPPRPGRCDFIPSLGPSSACLRTWTTRWWRSEITGGSFTRSLRWVHAGPSMLPSQT
jgi:hypothetical protein